jgi:hypothetical protein
MSPTSFLASSPGGDAHARVCDSGTTRHICGDSVRPSHRSEPITLFFDAALRRFSDERSRFALPAQSLLSGLLFRIVSTMLACRRAFAVCD